MFLHQYSAGKDLFYCASACPKSSLFFSQVFFCLFLESVENDSEHDLAGVANQAYCSVILALAEVSFFG